MPELLENPPVIAPPALYPLDQTEFVVEITAGKHILSHKLAKPTLAQLVERENASSYETESISNEEERVSAEDEPANARLWNQIAREVKGYRLNKADTHPITEWRPVTDELKAAIPASHKATAIRGLYQFTTEIESGEDEGFTLAGDTWTVKQIFGDADFPVYLVRHTLRTPSEAERREFKRKSSDVRFSKGARRMKTKIVTHLKAHFELYDKLIVGIDGTTNQDIATFPAMIDPIWKRSVIETLMREFEAGLQD